MAKAKLIYDLTDLDDAREHLAAVKSGDMASVLWEIHHNLKKSCHQEIEHDKKVYDHYEAVELVFEKIRDLLDENNIIIDELTC